MSSFVYIDNNKKDILILGEDPKMQTKCIQSIL